ncbi:mediator of RNA polymerase II transcription subunit 30-like [Artemia franciscana]|uniref:Mediator of RNA polymerase II transcription subunit 30 n=1 Tax=Artemia franciscana TaxID=6661 RepID=A0AA88HB00_ARTSF|nr:hypothetical protein QYM36_017581 [Artemia franciscana]
MYSQQGPPSAPSQPLTSPLPQPGTPSNLPISASQSSPGSFGGSFSQSSSTQPQSQSVPKEVALNLASLCKVGQDTVQDIVFRAQEIFQLLRTVQPPNNFGAVVAANSEKKMKILEQMKTIRTLFNRLKKICDKLDEVAEDPEDRTLESWIPMKGVENEFQNYKDSDAYRAANEERRELLEQIVIKNQHLKEIIDYTRNVIWEINSMLAAARK